MKPRITICIPTHNDETVIEEALQSAINQDYPDKEILVIDDASTDRTPEIVWEKFPEVKCIVNEKNLGIGKNLEKCMRLAKGEYVLFLCGDDVFTNTMVASDVCKVFNEGDPAVGVIGRYLYYFMNGKPGAIGTCREKNILLQSICPSGMAFKKMDVWGENKIFIEMPLIVSQYLNDWKWTMFEYDTVACRFDPGNNTGTKEEYYTQSPWKNLSDLIGKDFKDYPIYIMLKNRAPKNVWKEIKLSARTNKSILKDPKFYLYALSALLIPRTILKSITNVYRNTVSRRGSTIINRG